MMSKKIATVVDKLYFDLAFEIQWRHDMEELFKQAQELHKQQLEDAYFNGSCDRMNDEGSFEEYYIETYGPDEDADFEIED
jgi:hypothetical protein